MLGKWTYSSIANCQSSSTCEKTSHNDSSNAVLLRLLLSSTTKENHVSIKMHFMSFSFPN